MELKKNVQKRLRSKTYWLGIGTFVLGLLEVAQATGQLPELFDGKVRAVSTLVLAIFIFILRELTHSAMEDK